MLTRLFCRPLDGRPGLRHRHAGPSQSPHAVVYQHHHSHAVMSSITRRRLPSSSFTRRHVIHHTPSCTIIIIHTPSCHPSHAVVYHHHHSHAVMSFITRRRVPSSSFTRRHVIHHTPSCTIIIIHTPSCHPSHAVVYHHHHSHAVMSCITPSCTSIGDNNGCRPCTGNFHQMLTRLFCRPVDGRPGSITITARCRVPALEPQLCHVRHYIAITITTRRSVHTPRHVIHHTPSCTIIIIHTPSCHPSHTPSCTSIGDNNGCRPCTGNFHQMLTRLFCRPVDGRPGSFTITIRPIMSSVTRRRVPASSFTRRHVIHHTPSCTSIRAATLSCHPSQSPSKQ